MADGKRFLRDGAKSFLDLEFKPKESLLYPIIQKQSIVLVHAMAGVGKTYWGLANGVAVAQGCEFLEFQAKRRAKVLYIDGEMSGRIMQARLSQTYHALCGLGFSPEDDDYFTLCCAERQERIPNLAKVEDQKRINEELIQDAEFIIIDNLSCLVRGADENEAKGWQMVQDWLLELKAQGRTLKLLHHRGKSGSQRGTSKKLDVIDNEIKLETPPGYVSNQGVRFIPDFSGKWRGMLTPDQAKPFMAWLEDDPPYWRMGPVPTADDPAIDLFRQNKSVREVQEILNIGRTKAFEKQKQYQEQEEEKRRLNGQGHLFLVKDDD